MKKLSIIIASVVAGLFVLSCQKIHDFGDINKSPNSPSTEFTSYFFTEACKYVPTFVLRDATNGYDPWQQEWAGYLSESKNNQYGPLSTTSYFSSSTLYLRPIKNLQYIIDLNSNEETASQTNVVSFGSNANQIAVATTLQSFYFMTISDIQGPVILTEALKGASEDIWTPKYDTQEEVYTILNDRLTAAYKLFDETGSLNASADILYGGDIAKWKKFNATVRMLMAIKLCDVAPAVGKARFAAAYADGGLEVNDDGFNYTYDDLNWNYLYYWCSPDYAAAGQNAVPNYFIVETMKGLKDNRMFKYFDIEGYKGTRKESIFPRDQFSSFYGIPFGLESNDAVSAWGDCVSSVCSRMLDMKATIPVIPTSRVLFTEAEAAFRGWINADPKALYEAGIKSSFDWWEAQGADKYIASADVAYNASKGLEQIALQRWIACYLSDGIEVWSDWRRLDIPHMPVGPGASNTGTSHYPYRLPYYNDSETNPENYAVALKDLSSGKDDKSARVWWDVADNWEGVIPADECKPQIVIPADWQVVSVGEVMYDADVYQGEPPFANHEGKLYEDANHPGVYKISPFGKAELVFEAAGDEFVVGNQIIRAADEGGILNAADYNVDQEKSETGVCYYDTDDQAYYFLLIMRNGGPRGGGSTGIAYYGYCAFVPAAE
jgi:hypothetical protein